MLYRGPMGGGAASGKVGALVASHNSGGQYLRSRIVPTDPSTARQQTVRQAAGNLASAWSAVLTPAEREAWEVFGATGSFLNRLGDAITLSGIAAYIRQNVNRVQAGFASIEAAPTPLQSVVNDTALIPTVTAPSTVSIAFDATDEWATNVGGHLLVYISPPQSPGVNFYKGPYRLLDTIDGAVSPPSSPAAMDYADAGFGVLTADQKVFVQFRAVGHDGNIGGLVRASTVVL